MAEKMTRGQILYLVGKFAPGEPEVPPGRCSANPKGTIEKQLNTSLGGVTVKAVVDTADTVHVVIPYAASEGELSDADWNASRAASRTSRRTASVLGGTAVSKHRHAAQPLICAARALSAGGGSPRPAALFNRR